MMAGQTRVVNNMSSQSTNPYHISFSLCASQGQSSNEDVCSGNRKPNFRNNDYSYFNTDANEFHCDNCDRSFRNDAQFQQHMSEHIVCGREGCRFKAHPKIVSNHIRTQHDTGLYQKINKLKNPEEVAKWVAERKRRYPTRQNIVDKRKLEQGKEDRGERIRRDNSRFNKHMHGSRGPKYSRSGNEERRQSNRRNNERSKRARCERKSKFAPHVFPTQVANDEEMNGSVQRFRGTGYLYEEEIKPEPVDNSLLTNTELDDLSRISDVDDDFNIQPIEPLPAPVEDSKPVVSRSLSLLMASYGSDSSDGETNELPAKPVAQVPVNNTAPVTVDDDEPPEEVKTVKTNHVEEVPDVPVKIERRIEPPPKMTNVVQRYQRPRKPTLLEKLLQTEIIHERNIILQCVRHLVRNNFFDKVKVKIESVVNNAEKMEE